MESEIVEFFKKLSERHWIENDLSDMLWALLNVNNEFRNIFFDLIKSKNKDKDLSYLSSDNCLNIEREFYIKEVSGRPDMKFDFPNGRIFILEVKVGDKDHHHSYNGIPNADICLLTINKVKDSLSPGWINITWKEIHDHIREAGNHLIKGFATFLKGVFSMNEIKKVNTFEIKYLVYLNRMVEIALSEVENEGTYNVKRNNGTKSFSEDGSGYRFDFFLDEKIYLFPWIGINYNVESESGNPFGLMFWLNEYHRSHREIAERLSEDSNLKSQLFPSTEYHCKAGKDGLVIMPANFQERFLGMESKDEQIQSIKDFLLQCLSKLRTIFDVIEVKS